jgi:hypothetical protein
MENKLTYKDVIEITKDRYHNNPTLRSKNGFRCEYFNENGNKCAVGHFLIEENFNKNLLNSESINQLLFNDEDYELFMHESVRHLQNIDFWDELQFFHDKDDFWNESGLTEEGFERYNKLINDYANQEI